MNAPLISQPEAAAKPAMTIPLATAMTTSAERLFGHHYLAKVVALYVLFSVLWIFVSDELLAIYVQDPEMMLGLSMAKGWLFILITTSLLSLLISRFFRALIVQDREIQALNADLERRVDERTAELAAQIAERRTTEAQLREREEQLHLITENVQEFFWLSDTAISRIEYASPAYERIWQRPVAELYAQPTSFLAAVVPEDLPALQENLTGHEQGLPYAMEYRIRRPDGTLRWIWDRGFPIRDADGQVRRYAGLAQDITERRRLEEELRSLNTHLERKVAERTAEIQAAQVALRESEARYRTIVDNVVDSIYVLDLEGNFLAVNDYACQHYGYPREEFLKLHITAIDTPADAIHAPARLAAVNRDGQVAFTAHHQDAEGRPLDVEVRASKILFNGTPAMLSVVRDVTEQKQAEAKIRHLAYYDALTDLPNRVMGLECLAKHVAHAQRHRRHLALLVLDLDHFKHINDTFGHLAGDRLLLEVSQRLSPNRRAEDTLCRLAADEFMLVLPEVDKERYLADIAGFCDRMLALFAEPFDLDGHQIYISLSIGVALYPQDGTNGEALMRHANTALYGAKHAGRQTWRFFEPRMNDNLKRFIQTRDALRGALERQEFVLHYQPQIELLSGRVVGVEALVRWQRPGVGLVMPGDFIDVAEESGLIVPLGNWVLREACRQAAAWRASAWPDLVVAVNLSAVQFRRGQIGAVVLAALAESGLDPAGLEVELTESILLHNEDEVLQTVEQWKIRGIQVSIDDFGTGYSSLAYLRRFQVDKLKIDRSFVAHMAANDQDRIIVQAIIDMAQGLKLRTIAEGVDDALLASQIQFMGCDEAQGYLYARPLAAGDLEQWLRDRGEVGGQRQKAPG